MKVRKKLLEKRKKEFRMAVMQWGKKNLRHFPWRESFAPYEIFVAETLLRRTTSTAINRLYVEFISKFPDFTSLYYAKQEEIEVMLKVVGLSKQKADGLKRTSKYIYEHCNGEIPSNYHELRRVPFIGEYTAEALLSFAFGKSIPVVDSNINRIILRVFSDIFAKNSSNNEIKNFMTDFIPKKEHRLFNLSLIDLGSVICSFKYQKCTICPLSKVCMKYQEKNNSYK